MVVRARKTPLVIVTKTRTPGRGPGGGHETESILLLLLNTMLCRSTTLLSAARGTARFAASSRIGSVASSRLYSTPSQSKPLAQSNVGLYLSLGGAAGIGAWYAMGGLNGDLKSKIQEIHADGGSDVALDKDEWRTFKLKEVRPYNHDSSLYVFELPGNKRSGVFVESCIVVRGAGAEPRDDNDKPIIRPYTPVSDPNLGGELDLLIKHYPGGKMTQHLKTLKPGDELRMKGPNPKFPYKPNQFEHVALVAGGSGVTPMWQLAHAIMENPKDNTKVTILYANKKEEDILLREKFDQLASDPRFNIVHFLDSAPPAWKGETGYIDAKAIKKYFDLAGDNEKVKVFVCGPPPQMKAISGTKKSMTEQGPLEGALSEAGFKAEQVYKF